MIKTIDIGNGKYTIKYLDIDIHFSIYKCSRKKKSLIEEVKHLTRMLERTDIALIPVEALRNDLQIVQGIINYSIYRDRFSKVRNKGLLLSMLILGMDQLRTAIDYIEEKSLTSNEYYLIIPGHINYAVENCRPYCLNPVLDKGFLSVLAKNIDRLLDKL